LLLKSYVCAKCRKKHEVNAVGVDKPPEAVWDSSDAFWKQPGYVFPGSPDAPKPTKYSEADYADITLTTCLMPTTKLDGRCAICPHYAYCKLTDNKGNLHKLQDQVEINEQGHVIRRAKKAKAQYTDEADEVVESVKKVKKTKGRPKGSKNKKKKK
jgi:hypothetical protein